MKHSPYIIKAARALLGWKQDVLADRAGVSINTVRRLESIDNWEEKWGSSSVNMIKKIQAAFESANIEFLNDGEPGVRLKK